MDDDLTMRPLRDPGELDLFCRLPYVLDDELAGDLEAGRRHPGWMWMALRSGRLVARVAWWGRSGGGRPAHLDVVDIDDADPDALGVAVDLLALATGHVVPAGSRPPEYGRFVPPGWRDDPATARVVTDRMTILERSGAHLLVERLRLEWRPGTPVAAPGGRLGFRPPRDDRELIGLMARALDGTLDAHSRDDLTRMTAEEAATDHFEGELARYSSPREWWRVATQPDGEPVGFVFPARNDYHPIIAYLAVLPEHRGRGYIDEVLAEGTRILASADVPRIRASTDLANVPMAAAFGRAGWVNFERSINMTFAPDEPH